MIGDYTVMDWATLGGIATIILAILGVLISNSRDNKAIMREFEVLSDENKDLINKISSLSKIHYNEFILKQDNLSNNIDSHNKILVQKNASVKEDTKYIRDEMLLEKNSRLEVYNHVKDGDKLLKEIDFINELVIKFGEVSKENQELGFKINTLEEKIVDLSNQPKNEEISKLRSSIRSFESQLARFEDGGYNEAEEIKGALRRILNDLEG
ncbi:MULTISPECIES: hypothetical protein [Streptococcus]|uniref:hypothetical protein n=1 Tax=Streptococcus TaxID=1301 RepID=UPI00085CB867|nr:hypothetical protein [Streptococcus agalactiae]MBY5056804.1 hypothetical protein [Streptococcus agalactiae]